MELKQAHCPRKKKYKAKGPTQSQIRLGTHSRAETETGPGPGPGGPKGTKAGLLPKARWKQDQRLRTRVIKTKAGAQKPNAAQWAQARRPS